MQRDLRVFSLALVVPALFLAMPSGAFAASQNAQTRITGDGNVTSFYAWNSLATSPGVLLRNEPLEPRLMLTNAAAGERILYAATNGVVDNSIVAVSGDVFLPKGTPPANGWPIIAWAHGTTGIADVCAPSWRGRSKRDQTYLNGWLGQGFAIVASDYQGLGTPGIHTYMLPRPEGYDTLDAVRAALQLYPSILQNRVVIVGQSQGSAAALSTAALAKQYSPSLNVAGVVATGLVVTMTSPVSGAPQIPVPPFEGGGSVDAAYSMLYLIGMDQSMDPRIDATDFVTPEGASLLQKAGVACLSDLIKLADEQRLTPANTFTPARSTLLKSEQGYQAISTALFAVPVFTGTGLADAEASPADQYNYISDMCKAGSQVQWHYYPGLTHNGTVNVSFADSLPFVRALLDGTPMVSNCATLHEPGPLQTPTPSVPFNT